MHFSDAVKLGSNFDLLRKIVSMETLKLLIFITFMSLWCTFLILGKDRKIYAIIHDDNAMVVVREGYGIILSICALKL